MVEGGKEFCSVRTPEKPAKINKAKKIFVLSYYNKAGENTKERVSPKKKGVQVI